MRTYTRKLIYALKESFKDKQRLRGAEIGVWRGDTSSELFRAFPNLTLLMVDPWEKAPMMETMNKTAAELTAAYNRTLEHTDFAKDRRVIIHEPSVVAAPEVPDRSLDFIFIDANHMYEGVSVDIKLWEPKVRKGGVVAGHDYDGKGDRDGGWGVKRAVDEYIAQHGYTLRTARGTIWWFVK